MPAKVFWTLTALRSCTLVRMGKNLALFIDGTGNSGTRDKPLQKETNVYHLFELCQESCKLYQGGVGSSRLDILGGVTDFGTKERLKHAYRFLIDNYRTGDNIFLFGFSRGAFAVRLLQASSVTSARSSASLNLKTTFLMPIKSMRAA